MVVRTCNPSTECEASLGYVATERWERREGRREGRKQNVDKEFGLLSKTGFER